MGIKFKNKLSAGIPATGDIAEREIHLDLKNSKVFSSSNGTDVIELGVTKEKGGVEWDATAVYNANTLVTIHDPTMHPQLSYKQFFSLTSNNMGNDPLTDSVNWIEDNVVKYLSEDITVTVGATGDFDRLDTALLYLSRYQMVDGKKLTIEIENNHVIDYNVNIIGANMGAFEIVAQGGATITVDNGHFRFFDTNAPVFALDINALSAGTATVNGEIFAVITSILRYRGTITGATSIEFAFLGRQQANINVSTSTVSGFKSHFRIQTNSSFIAVYTDFKDHTGVCLEIEGAAIAVFDNVKVKSAGVNGGVTINGGGKFSAFGSDLSVSGVNHADNTKVLGGSTASLTNNIGGISQVQNIPTGDGIIFR